MAHHYRKTGVNKRPRQAVPITVWLATGALFLCVVLFAHLLPEAKTAEALEYFNINRLERFSSNSSHPLRVVVVGSSLSMCGLFFDEDMERLAREKGVPLEFIRFIKLDANLTDFVPLLEPILKAEPDIVFFEANHFVLGPLGADDRDMKRLRFFAPDTGGDDRTKLRRFFQAQFDRLKRKGPVKKKDNPNIPLSEKRVLLTLRQRQTQNDFEMLQEQRADRTGLRRFSVPDGYQAFFDALKQKHIACVMLELPHPPQWEATFPREVVTGMPPLIKRYEEVYGLTYLAYPETLGLEYFKDFTHLNDRGRVLCSQWFVSALPGLVKKGEAL